MKSLLIATLALAALAASPAGAQSPHDGAWTLDPARSFWSNTGPLPANFRLTVNFKFSPNHLVYHSINTTQAKPYISDHETSLDGKVFPFPGQERFNQVSVTETDPNDLQILKMKDGDVIAGEFWTFSADDKTAIRRGVGKSPEGKSHAYQEFFVRQP
jgi:hypothetical protein